MIFYGSNGRQANPWGTGTSFQCVVPPVQRMGLIQGTGAPNTCDGVLFQEVQHFPRVLQYPTCGAIVRPAQPVTS